MIEDIFLTYANNSLKGHPEKLHDIFRVIRENMDINLDGTDEDIEIICGLSQYDDPKEFISATLETYKYRLEYRARGAVAGRREWYYLDLYKSQEDEKFKQMKESLNRVYGFDDDSNCEYHSLLKALGRDSCKNGFVQKCYECFQLDFIDFLQDVVDGKEYSAIEDIGLILFYASLISTRRTYRNIGKAKQNGPFDEELEIRDSHNIGYMDFWGMPEADDPHAFCIYLNAIAFFSLTEFILHNDRRKIHKCKECGNFYVSKTIRPSAFCSDKCRLKLHNRNRIASGEHAEYKRKQYHEGKK